MWQYYWYVYIYYIIHIRIIWAQWSHKLVTAANVFQRSETKQFHQTHRMHMFCDLCKHCLQLFVGTQLRHDVTKAIILSGCVKSIRIDIKIIRAITGNHIFCGISATRRPLNWLCHYIWSLMQLTNPQVFGDGQGQHLSNQWGATAKLSTGWLVAV